MTREEIVIALKEGKTVTHQYFAKDEWVRQQGNIMIFEDGCQQTENEFWDIRSFAGWDNGWEIL